MPVYQIHRMRDHPRQHFRWAPHTSGASTVKAKDYEPGGTVEAATEYAAWKALQDAGTPLEVGDLLDGDPGGLRIYKYVGFEEAHWFVPEAPAEVPAADETPTL